MTYVRNELLQAADTAHTAIWDLYGITEDTLNESRVQHVTEARKALWLHLRNTCGASFPELGQLYYRDHTTILHGCRTANPELVAQIGRHVQGNPDTPHDHYLAGHADGYTQALHDLENRKTN